MEANEKKIEEIEQPETELKPEEAEATEGGLLPAVNVALGDGSVRFLGSGGGGGAGKVSVHDISI